MEDFIAALFVVITLAGLFWGASWCITTHKKCKRDVVTACLQTGHTPKDCFVY